MKERSSTPMLLLLLFYLLLAPTAAQKRINIFFCLTPPKKANREFGDLRLAACYLRLATQKLASLQGRAGSGAVVCCFQFTQIIRPLINLP